MQGSLSVAADVGRITAVEQNRTFCNSGSGHTHTERGRHTKSLEVKKWVNVPPTGRLAD